MDKLDYAVLDLMIKSQAVTKMSAITRKAIHEDLDVTIDTLYRRLAGLIKTGYAKQGIKDRREYTYYVTAKGKQAFKEAMNEE